MIIVFFCFGYGIEFMIEFLVEVVESIIINKRKKVY